MRRALPLALLLLGWVAPPAEAGDMGTYRFDPQGDVVDVRVLDMNADGRPDLVILVRDPANGRETLVVARTPSSPVRRTFFAEGSVTRIPCGGNRAACGAIAVGRFGLKGEGRIRFLGPDGIVQVRHDNAEDPSKGHLGFGTLLARSPGKGLIFWDGVADLDGDGRDEMWAPLAEGDGPLHVFGGSGGGLGGAEGNDRTLRLTANNIGASTESLLLSRYAYIPNLFPADLDGDGHRELVALDKEDLIAWDIREPSAADRLLSPTYRLHLPFLEPDPKRPPTRMHVPRIQVQDVDGDGTADLLVTLLTGEHGKLQSLRTTFFHYAGPFRAADGKGLVKPSSRLDTKSCVLHPLFVDVNRDGTLDYVGDSMHGSQAELFARLLGKEPRMTYVGFRWSKTTRAYEEAPAFSFDLPYASSETLSNRFGRSAWFSGDFDGDGHGDLLDLGNLQGARILRGRTGTSGKASLITYEGELLPHVPVKEGLRAAAQVTDLNGDGRSDAILWSEKAVFLIVPKGAR